MSRETGISKTFGEVPTYWARFYIGPYYRHDRGGASRAKLVGIKKLQITNNKLQTISKFKNNKFQTRDFVFWIFNLCFVCVL